MERAFGLQPYAIEGLPQWASEARFEIQAKAPERDEPYGSAETLSMIRQLLAERFGLQQHYEPRVRPVFLLSREHPDRQLSKNFRPARAECAGMRPADAGPIPDGVCGIRSHVNPENGSVTLTYQARSLSEFADELVRRAGRPVLDRTGVVGQYDIDLANEGGVELSTLLREQLGLRLIGDEAPIDVLIVDAIHRPSPD